MKLSVLPVVAAATAFAPFACAFAPSLFIAPSPFSALQMSEVSTAATDNGPNKKPKKKKKPKFVINPNIEDMTFISSKGKLEEKRREKEARRAAAPDVKMGVPSESTKQPSDSGSKRKKLAEQQMRWAMENDDWVSLKNSMED
mmetsp:Transcript_9999/g.21128  ORF Transcript_9999/g.21128 Transcript_9999/m.21128 type:complete len:143 (-) Transcript_9999:42-470(-)|eukprot:CAMPEP_0183324044 /NCGR_PEP_ID=MMETSP0160_2-20130417/75992_1 /TAXON_ID=2839 ORGANISM="Odontella Sinensis, Strain Grunow 1884" /NCGR_SAMPLE_ID=MMETSP0160_2 /ASSEMBLY_ACC=CAM_ASM_000250 /LENGTH=142 /DNA_ID=CAMNT_0025491547 /DNA_START=324 /DNA_END=752 /DNA_ORIENTATION=+